jgi:hypothetical protein
LGEFLPDALERPEDFLVHFLVVAKKMVLSLVSGVRRMARGAKIVVGSLRGLCLGWHTITFTVADLSFGVA